MRLQALAITGPFTHENLSIFLFRGSDSFDGRRFIPLGDAMEQKTVIVHETGNVGQLEIENLSDRLDLYAQAGDVVKGGRQDRTLGVDFVLPAKSGRVPVPTFCVESGRWRQRGAEDVRFFSSSDSSLFSKNLRVATKLRRNQGAVWDSVAYAQVALSTSLSADVSSSPSPTSYQLTVENADVKKRQAGFRTAFEGILADKPNAIGYAFEINGEINTADVFGSAVLFQKLWRKLLDTAILEAIAESHKTSCKPQTATADSIREWFSEADRGQITDRRQVPPRVRVETRRSKKSVLFDTCDLGLGEAVLHRNLVAH